MNMKNKKKTSIQAKTLIYLLTFNIVIIVLLWICQISIFDFYYEKEQINNMDSIVSSLKNASAEEIGTLLQDVAYQNEVCIAITSDTGIIATYNANMNGCALSSRDSKARELMIEFVNSDSDFQSLSGLRLSSDGFHPRSESESCGQGVRPQHP